MYTAVVDPTSVAVGGSQTFTVTLRNVSGAEQVLGSAEITVTGGFTAISADLPNVSGWDRAVDDNVVQLTSSPNNEVGPNGQVSVDITVTAPPSTGSNTWTTEAKESTDFTGEANLLLSGEDPVVTVTPGPIDHFAWTSQPAASQMAGAEFEAEATAYDEFDNIITTYDVGTLATDLSTAPDDVSTPIANISWADGVGTATVTAYAAETERHLTVSDPGEGGPSQQSDAFEVGPGALGALTVTDPVGPLTAGEEFSVTVAASDVYENAGADAYWNSDGCVLFSGPFNSPPDALKSPDYPAQGACSTDQSELTFDSSGEAPANMTLYRASTTFTDPSTQSLTVEAEGKQDTTEAFSVNPGTDLFRFRWTDQPDRARRPAKSSTGWKCRRMTSGTTSKRTTTSPALSSPASISLRAAAPPTTRPSHPAAPSAVTRSTVCPGRTASPTASPSRTTRRRRRS